MTFTVAVTINHFVVFQSFQDENFPIRSLHKFFVSWQIRNEFLFWRGGAQMFLFVGRVFFTIELFFLYRQLFMQTWKLIGKHVGFDSINYEHRNVYLTEVEKGWKPWKRLKISIKDFLLCFNFHNIEKLSTSQFLKASSFRNIEIFYYIRFNTFLVSSLVVLFEALN